MPLLYFSLFLCLFHASGAMRKESTNQLRKNDCAPLLSAYSRLDLSLVGICRCILWETRACVQSVRYAFPDGVVWREAPLSCVCCVPFYIRGMSRETGSPRDEKWTSRFEAKGDNKKVYNIAKKNQDTRAKLISISSRWHPQRSTLKSETKFKILLAWFAVLPERPPTMLRRCTYTLGVIMFYRVFVLWLFASRISSGCKCLDACFAYIWCSFFFLLQPFCWTKRQQNTNAT